MVRVPSAKETCMTLFVVNVEDLIHISISKHPVSLIPLLKGKQLV